MKRWGCLLVVAAIVAVPLIELTVGILVARRWGGGLVLLWLLGALVVGSLVLRRQGPASRQRLRTAWQSGQPPEVTLIETVLIYLAALLLMLPGLVSDALALPLLLPVVRPWLARRLLHRLGRWLSGRRRPPSPGSPPPYRRAAAGDVIDITAREVKDSD